MKTLAAALVLLAGTAVAHAGGRVTVDFYFYVKEAIPEPEPLKKPRITKTNDPKKIAAFNQGYQSEVVNGYCGSGGKLFNLKVDEAIRDELDNLYVSFNSKTLPKLWKLGSYWIEGREQARYDCELADQQSSGSGMAALYRKAAALPQPKPWLDASEVVKCDEMPNYFACKEFK